MASTSKTAIVKIIQTLAGHSDIDGNVRVVYNDDETAIDINYDNRKYIGRLRLEWKGDKFAVYLMDKDEGKVVNSTYLAAKSVYLLIKDTAEARKFVKWYVLITELAAMKRVRKAA